MFGDGVHVVVDEVLAAAMGQDQKPENEEWIRTVGRWKRCRLCCEEVGQILGQHHSTSQFLPISKLCSDLPTSVRDPDVVNKCKNQLERGEDLEHPPVVIKANCLYRIASGRHRLIAAYLFLTTHPDCSVAVFVSD